MNFNGISTYWGNDVITTQTILYETTNEIEMQVTYASENKIDLRTVVSGTYYIVMNSGSGVHFDKIVVI